MYRIILLTSLITIIQCAPSPYYTRSFVRTPTSQVEQYFIMPDKNDPMKLPMSQVHDLNEFKFPKRQVLYQKSETQSDLEEMREDSPMWQNLMEAMKQKESMKMMQSTDDALENEMMSNVNVMSSKIAQRETRLMTEAIMRDDSNAEIINKPIIVASNEKMAQDDAIREELMSIMMEKTMTESMKQKMMELLEATEPQFDQKLITEIEQNNNDQLNIMEMLKKLNSEDSPRESKAMDMIDDAVVVESSSQAPIDVMEMIRQMESTSERPSEIIENSSEENLSSRISSDETSEKPKSMIEIMQEILKINEASLNEMMRLLEQTTTVAPAVKEEVQKFTESLRENTQEEIRCNKTETPMSPEVMQRIIEMLSNIEGATVSSTTQNDLSSTEEMIINDQSSTTSREPKMMELELVSNSDDVQGENMEIRMVEITTDAMSEDIENTSSTERITSTVEELKTSSTTSTEAIVIQSESTTETPTRTRSEISSESDAEINAQDSKSDSSSEQESIEQATIARQGRMNESPTLFLHNNRFYVVSGAPEFYANFDAYQRSRTPIFSLQELQSIKPMEKNVRVQKVEPFRIFVEDENDNTRNGDEGINDGNEKDSQARDIEIQSMKSTAMEVKKPEQASAGEGQYNLLYCADM